jgi:hypothetical protein
VGGIGFHALMLLSHGACCGFTPDPAVITCTLPSLKQAGNGGL